MKKILINLHGQSFMIKNGQNITNTLVHFSHYKELSRYYQIISSYIKKVCSMLSFFYARLISKCKFREGTVFQRPPVSRCWICNFNPGLPPYLLLTFPSIAAATVETYPFPSYFFLTNALLLPYGSQTALNVFNTHCRWNSDFSGVFFVCSFFFFFFFFFFCSFFFFFFFFFVFLPFLGHSSGIWRFPD